jgi:hypothetical protein
LVNIVDEWKEMQIYAGNTSRWTGRAYQVLEIETPDKKKRVQIKVQVGKFGFEQDFPDRNDPTFQKIYGFCVSECFFNVNKTVQDEQFFK